MLVDDHIPRYTYQTSLLLADDASHRQCQGTADHESQMNLQWRLTDLSQLTLYVTVV
jgi:hypothetical protein